MEISPFKSKMPHFTKAGLDLCGGASVTLDGEKGFSKLKSIFPHIEDNILKQIEQQESAIQQKETPSYSVLSDASLKLIKKTPQKKLVPFN